MSRVHLFNPDTDYALASGREYYTAPAEVVRLRRRLALLPALYATPGDIILLADIPDTDICSLPYADLVEQKTLRVITPDDIPTHAGMMAEMNPEPWGWNLSVRRFLLDHIGEMSGMPSAKEIDTLRELSHRRTTISMLQAMSDMLADEISLPVETDDTELVTEMFRRDRRLFFKAPWSSSGRGVMLADDLEERHVLPWVRGIIRRQGSVMIEKAYQRRLDFATEWICENGSARFIGYSVFNVSRRGKYQNNFDGSQAELLSEINSVTKQWTPQLLASQRMALEKIVAPHYSGPLGIDMLVTDSGNVNPCVEVNLRHTMGMLNLLYHR